MIDKKLQYYYYELQRRHQNYIYATYRGVIAGAEDAMKQYLLKFTALEDNSTVKLASNIPAGKQLSIQPHLLISYDAKTWQEYEPDTILHLLSKGDYVYFCASKEGNERFADIRTPGSVNGARNADVLSNSLYYFQMSGKIAATGSIMSLLDQDPNKAALKENPEISEPSTTTGAFTFFGLFYNCTSLVKAPELTATALASHCYDCMFRGCTSLEEMPDLPAEELVVGCYMHMFNGCIFTHTKKLNTKKVYNAACYGMFWGCANLEEANIFDDCEFKYADTFAFRYIFRNCTNLRKGTNIHIDGIAGHATCNSVFQDCALSSAPNIYVKELKNRSGLYGSMFINCTQLSSVTIDYLKNSAATISSHLSAFDSHDPDDGATAQSINVKEVYSNMFQNCTSLTSAPFLYECALSTRIYKATGQYNSIFKGCSMLSTVYTDFSDYSLVSSNFTSASISGCAPTGTLYCKDYAALSAYENNLVPPGWSLAKLPDDFVIP